MTNYDLVSSMIRVKNYPSNLQGLKYYVIMQEYTKNTEFKNVLDEFLIRGLKLEDINDIIRYIDICDLSESYYFEHIY